MRVRLLGLLGVLPLVLGCTSADPDASPQPSEPPSSSTTASTSADPSDDPPPEELSEAEQARLDRRLRDAAWTDDVRRARRLIEKGADVNAKDNTQQSAYLIATSEGYLELLELTLRHDARVDDKDSFNGTGLIRAAERGHADVVGRLLQSGIDKDHVNNLGWTALHEAVHLGDGSERYLDTVRVLVAGGVDVDVESPRDGATPLAYARAQGFDDLAFLIEAAAAQDGREPDRATADRRLLEGARAGDGDAVALALRAGARLEVRDDDRRTPLLLAAANDRVPVARVLVALGADPDALDAIHDTPWLVTGVTGSVAMLEALLPAHPDLTIRNRFGGLSVIPASERGHVDYVRRVVQTDIDVNHVNDLGWTALLEAVILGDGSAAYQEIGRILRAAGADLTIADGDADGAAVALRAGADIEARDEAGRTALLLASAADHLEVARVLVAMGASPDAVDGRSDTPWLVTGVTGSVPMAELLLRHDPDLSLRNRYGGVSIIPASERGHVDYVRRVARTAIDVNHVNDLGWTALLEAVILGDGSAPYQQIVQILLDAGADPGITDKDGVTALEHARSSGQEQVAAILSSAG